MLVEGYGLQKVMTTDGIVGEYATTNHIIETAAVLGIEAARANIINEIKFIMQEHGMSIDPRHVMLLGDVMTYKVPLALSLVSLSTSYRADHACNCVGRDPGYHPFRCREDERQRVDARVVREDDGSSVRCICVWEDG